jgi:hypothetical protein
MMADFPLTTLRKGFPVMFTFDDYHEIETTRRFLSVLFNAKFESFELGEEDVEDYKQQCVDLLLPLHRTIPTNPIRRERDRPDCDCKESQLLMKWSGVVQRSEQVAYNRSMVGSIPPPRINLVLDFKHRR